MQRISGAGEAGRHPVKLVQPFGVYQVGEK